MVASAEVYHRPSAADDIPAAVHAAAVPVSTDSIDTSSGKNTQQPDIKIPDEKASKIVSSLTASVEAFETFTYSNYAAEQTSSSSPVATPTSDPVQEAIKAAESYASRQQNVALPTVTVRLVMEPTQEADGSWDYVVKVGADGTATASPTWVAAPTASATSSASDYYVPSASASEIAEPTIVRGEQSAPVESATSEYYYGNTHTYNGTVHTDTTSGTESPHPFLDSTIRTFATTTSSHFAFQCADATSYYYSDTSDATQVCPGGTVCRFVDTACSPCVWPDQDIWCAGRVYPFVDPAPEASTEPVLPSTTAQVQPTTEAQVQPTITQAPVEPTTTQATTYITGSGYHSASGETGRGAVTFTYTTSNAAIPTPVTTPAVTTSEQAHSSSVSGSDYASAPVETAWTSGHGGQHSYPWMTEPAATITSAESEPVPTSVEMTSTLSNGAVIVTLVPSSSSSAVQSASTSINSWLVEATKGIDPVQGGSTSVSSAQPTASITESASATVPAESVSVSTTEAQTTDAASSTYFSTEPFPTAAPSGFPSNETLTQSNVETATATDSVLVPTSTQSANEETLIPTGASSSSGILVPTSAAGNGTDTLEPTASVTSQASAPVLTASASASITDPTDNGIATETVTDWDIVNATSTTYVPWETASATLTQSSSEAVSATDSASTGAPVESASSTQSTWESMVTPSASSTDSVQATESATSSEVQSTEWLSATATASSSAAEPTETGSDEDECEEWEEVWVDEADIQPDWIVVE